MQGPLTNRHGERLAYSFEPGAPGSRELVVLGHGVTSDKERPWSQALARGLAEAGIASLRIAFAGNGESEGRFEDATITKEVDDVRAVLDAVGAGAQRDVSYVGHSMGGAVGLLASVADERIRTLVSLAAVGHPREFVQRMFGHLRPGDPMLDKPHCPFGDALKTDLETIDSLVRVAARVKVPWLLVHGTEDDVVPCTHSRDVHAAAGPNAELVELDGVDHSFTGDGLERMTSAVLPWLVERLRS